MDSKTQPVTELFREKGQYLIPLFQRGYVWGVADGRWQVPRLWADIVDSLLAHGSSRRHEPDWTDWTNRTDWTIRSGST